MSSSSSTMLPHHTISITISDDESETPTSTSTTTLLKSRKNRTKLYNHHHQQQQQQQSLTTTRSKKKNAILYVAVKKLINRWSLLVFLPAIAFIVFVAFNIFGDHMDPIIPVVVNPVRHRCLKILAPNEVENLGIPSVETPSFPVNKIVYISETDNRTYIGANATLPHQQSSSTRFNLFTGYQTLHERVQSFKVNETAVVHCGFYSENGGFKIADEDKKYMQNCEVVVSTCVFGGGDDLYQPIGMSKASVRKVCYVAFWDDITLKMQELEGHKIGEDNMIGKWRVVVVRELPFVDQRLNGKIPKLLGHRLFPRARYSIWVDSKSQFRRDPLGVLEVLLWRTQSVLAISEHGARSSVYDEGKAVVKKNKATPEEVEVQLSQYRQDGFPDDKRFNGKKALAEASIIVREHTPLTNLFMCLWFNEVVRFTSRDQLSFPYVLRQLGVLKNVNLFPVCTRKDLVNSMGHKRKARSHISQIS